MSNPQLDSLMEDLINSRNRAKNEYARAYWQRYIDKLEAGIDIYEREVENALVGALRHSEFPGDMVGRPDDDYDYFDDDYHFKRSDNQKDDKKD